MGEISGRGLVDSWLLYPLLKILITLMFIFSHVYDYLSYPIYYFVQKPWLVLKYRKGQHSQQGDMIDSEVTYHSTVQPTRVNMDFRRYNLNTVDKVFSHAIGKQNDRQALGTREIIEEVKVPQPDGKVHTKYNLGEYHFISFREWGDRAERFGRGLRELGVEPKERVVMFSETRADWMIAAYGCFQHSLTIVTLYTNLGDDGIIHGISETEVSSVICSFETYGKLVAVVSKYKDQIPHLKRIIVFKDQAGKPVSTRNCPPEFNTITFEDVMSLGENAKGTVTSISCPPGPDDIAIIMYTSGSTGKPKGVMLSHHNLVAAMGALCNVFDFKGESDRYIAYLPLAHVLELLAESCCLFYGIKIGYSSSLTLTSMSSKVSAGCDGDATALKATLMCAVPLVLERIFKTVNETIRKSGWFAAELFHYMVEYKTKWQDRGFDTPLLNKTIFRRIRYLLGGKVRVVLSGGAPLSGDTQSLCRTCLSMPVIQGYGLTETTSCTSTTSARDRTTGRAGAPLMNVDIKLVNWEDGNYRVTDKPCPRGEIHVGGDNVAVGYFKNPKETAECFYEKDGKRWFKTGDIGTFDADGVLRIIDRKKDLVKLQHGEYVSYGKVESILKTAPIVENICAYADPTKDFIIAIIIPDKKKLKDFNPILDVNELVRDPDVHTEIVDQLKAYGLRNGLKPFELPKRVLLVLDEWTPDNGLVTAAFKIRRNFIYNEYRSMIDKAYL